MASSGCCYRLQETVISYNCHNFIELFVMTMISQVPVKQTSSSCSGRVEDKTAFACISEEHVRK